MTVNEREEILYSRLIILFSLFLDFFERVCYQDTSFEGKNGANGTEGTST